MSGQIAKLFLRGSLVNITAKNLDSEQLDKVKHLMDLTWNDPKLDNAKHKFCNILASTIGGEYANKDFAMNEVWITLWRTAVDVLYHNPRPHVADDPIIRKKHFKACIFNYMRQILNENKIPTTLRNKKVVGPADIVAKEVLTSILDHTPPRKISYTVNEEETVFFANTLIIPLKTMQKIWKLRDNLRDQGVTIKISNEKITIESTDSPEYVTRKIKERIRINAISLTGIDREDTKNNFQQYCEFNAIKQRENEVDQMMVEDVVRALHDRLPKREQSVFKLLYFKPKDFMDKYYPRRKKEVRPKEIHIAQWLGMSKTEVIESMDSIKEQALALDIG